MSNKLPEAEGNAPMTGVDPAHKQITKTRTFVYGPV